MRQELFSFDEPSIETIAKRLGRLYEGVSLSRDPMFAWVQMTNDVTILGEDLRRGPARYPDAVERAGNALWRLLEFVGYYLHVHKRNNSLGDKVATLLRARTHIDLMPDSPQEGPTRWILAKYPFVCSKCGGEACRCVLQPWVLENRREDPEKYYADFFSKAKAARQALKEKERPEFTLRTMFDHFKDIYQHTYYHQEPWKIGMHLCEEVGEATTELSRIDLAWRAQRFAKFDLKESLRDTFRITGYKLKEDLTRIKKKRVAEKRNREVMIAMRTLKAQLEEDPWGTYERLVATKFKEEVSDIFSWLAAIVSALDPHYKTFRALPLEFSKAGKGTTRFLGCPWCQSGHCDDACLVQHSLSSEIREEVSKF